jgi:hypothetical protein
LVGWLLFGLVVGWLPFDVELKMPQTCCGRLATNEGHLLLSG